MNLLIMRFWNKADGSLIRWGVLAATFPLTYTSDSTYDVGIHDEAGLKMFNPPSLRGVSQHNGWVHNSRARSLEDVLDQGHYTQSELTADERAALLRFLKSL